MTKCRCGHEGSDNFHPCHGNKYSCKKPATIRFYNPKFVSLAGMQLKMEVMDTWACDNCWKEYENLIKLSL